MPEIVFLPWLGCKKRCTAAGVEFVPAAEYVEDLETATRQWLEKYLRRYVRRDGKTPAGTACIAKNGPPEEIFRRVRIVAASHLVYANAHAIMVGHGGVVPPRAERWMIFVQRFDPSKNWVAVEHGYTLSGFLLDSFLEVEPLSAGEVVRGLDKWIGAMADALLQEEDEHFLTGIELLAEAFRTTTDHVVRLNFVLAGTAFELLTGAYKAKRGKGVCIAAALKRAVQSAAHGYAGKADPVERALGLAARVDPQLVYLWMAGCHECFKDSCGRHGQRFEGFYKRRNKVIHEGTAGGNLAVHQRPDNGENHAWKTGHRGAHAVDAALAMAGWLLLERVGGRLAREDWEKWCWTLNGAAAALGMGSGS